MASSKKHPWGRAYAVLPDPKDTQKRQWVELGVAWLNVNNEGKETMRLILLVEPVAWRDPSVERVIDIQKTVPRDDAR